MFRTSTTSGSSCTRTATGAMAPSRTMRSPVWTWPCGTSKAKWPTCPCTSCSAASAARACRCTATSMAATCPRSARTSPSTVRSASRPSAASAAVTAAASTAIPRPVHRWAQSPACIWTAMPTSVIPSNCSTASAARWAMRSAWCTMCTSASLRPTPSVWPRSWSLTT